MKLNKKLIKDMARERGISLTDKEIKEAHENVLDMIEGDEEEYYYAMKDYLNN